MRRPAATLLRSTPRSSLRTWRGRTVGARARELSSPDAAGGEVARTARRAARGARPLAYVLGEWGFRRLLLSVDGRVLVPRPRPRSSWSAASRGSRPRGGTRARRRNGKRSDRAGGRRRASRCEGDRDRRIAGALEVAPVRTRANRVAIGLRAGISSRVSRGPSGCRVSNPPYVLPEEIGDAGAGGARLGTAGRASRMGATEAGGGSLDVLRPGGALVLEVGVGRCRAGGDAAPRVAVRGR